MTNQHPITPPHELIEEWIEQFKGDHPVYVAIQAAKWGADQELEACCEYVYERFKLTTAAHIAQDLRTSRRPKPPSLKEQALEIVRGTPVNSAGLYSHEDVETIRRALEALPE